MASDVEHVVKRAQKGRFAFVLGFLVLAVAITYAIAVNVEQGGQLTKIEKTPCAKDASSHACEQLRIEVEKSATTEITCIPFTRAGYICPKPGSPLAKGGGDASKPETGTSLPAPPSTGAPEQPVEAPAASPPAEPTHPIRETVEGTLEGVHEAVCSTNILGIEVCR